MENQYRIIYSKFWNDSFITKLDPLDRYIFLYLLTNEHTNIAGIYELPIRVMEFETGLEKETLRVILTRLESKIEYFENSWVFIKNFGKYQNLNSPNIRISIAIILRELPESVKGLCGGLETLTKGFHIEKSIVEKYRVEKIRVKKN